MAPKNKATKLPVDKAKASKAAAFAAVETAVRDDVATMEPPALRGVGDSTMPPRG